MSDEASRQYWTDLESAYGDSPIHRQYGLELSVVSAGRVIVRLPESERASNRQGNTAGAIIFLLIDSAVVQARRTQLEPGFRTSTVEAKVSFLRPAQGPLSAEGWIEHAGRSLAVGQCRVTNLDGDLVALGMVTVSARPPREGSS